MSCIQRIQITHPSPLLGPFVGFPNPSKDDELQGRNWCAASCRALRKERF